jgi:catechol 2,3-dioxygenase-like lactoylglutathione lyase family enzyme
MNGAPPPLKRIDHIVALVRDLDPAFDTYTQRLGFPISWQVESKDGWRSSALWLGNASLELLEPSADGVVAAGAFFKRALEARGEGLFLVAFEPAEIDYSVRALRRRGAQVADPVSSAVFDPGRKDGLRGYRSAFINRRSTPGLNSFICQYDKPFIPLDGGEGPLNVKKLDHVIIATEDLDEATRLWERNVGLGPDASLSHPLGAGFKVARLPIGDAFLELVQPVDKEGRFYEQFQQRGEGLFSISVEVEDLDEAVMFLRRNDVKVSDPEASIWPGARLARINHEYTHGVSIQLIQRPSTQ